MNPDKFAEKVFSITNEHQFNETALEIFQWQSRVNPVYRLYLQHLKIHPPTISTIQEIPFLPIELFKKHKIYCGERIPGNWFESSGTTGTSPSYHYFDSYNLYERSFNRTFRLFYGEPLKYQIFALMPAPEERPRSSLVYMVNNLISQTQHPDSGFYLHRMDMLARKLQSLTADNSLKMVIGISYALLDFIEHFTFQDIKNLIVVETGGMKGRRREMIREELHRVLMDGFGVETIHSEYGMTELFSQAWSQHQGLFRTPPWMKVMVRNINDPFEILNAGRSGCINVIDLANLYSCCFIATEDIGRILPDGSFEVLGRLDYAELRGCNLLVYS